MNRLFLFQTMELLIINLLQNDTPRNLFTELSTGSRIPYKGNLYDKTLTRFSQTYSRIIQTFTAAHIPVITCGVVGNEKDMPPFQSEMRIDSAQRIHLLQSIETTPHRTFSAIKNLARNDAGAFFDAARVLLRSDNLDLARQCFKEARDLDPFRVRASSDINEGIKDISRKHQCPYIDFQKEIEEIAETGVVGNRFLVEHVHPTIETHTFMARKLTELICNDILSIPFHDEYGEIEPMVSLVDLVNSCEVLLELFTDFPYKDHDYFNAHALNTIFDTNSPLFKKLYQENNIALLFERADSIAHPTINKKALRKIIDLFLKHRNLAKVHCAYGAHLMTQNQLHRAYLEYIIASKQAPGYPVPLNNMAVLAWNAGLTEESLSIFDFMNLRFPDFTQGCENYYLAAKRSGMNRAAAQLEEHLKRSGVDPTRIRHMSIVDY